VCRLVVSNFCGDKDPFWLELFVDIRYKEGVELTVLLTMGVFWAQFEALAYGFTSQVDFGPYVSPNSISVQMGLGSRSGCCALLGDSPLLIYFV